MAAARPGTMSNARVDESISATDPARTPTRPIKSDIIMVLTREILVGERPISIALA